MLSFIISFFSGFVTSLAGTLIPGNLNATAMEITMSRGKTAGILFGAGSAIIEIIYIRLTLMGIGFFIRQKNLFDILQWVVAGLFFLAGVYVFIKSFHKKKGEKKRKRRQAANLVQAFFLG